MSNRPAPAVPGRVFVTGAGGFIASALRQRFTELGATVHGVDLLPGDHWVTGSTEQPVDWAHELAGIDLVIHTAALVSNVAPLPRAWQVNVAATRAVIDAAAAAGVPHVIHLSSIAAFGHDFPDRVTEDYPPRITGNPYGDTKVASEAVALAAHAAGLIDITVIRPGDIYGPGSRPWVLLPLEVIRKGQLILPDGGRGIFTPTYIDDLVDGIVLAAVTPGANGQVITLTDGYGVPCRDYFGRLADLVGGRVRTLPRRPGVALIRAVGAAERALGRDSELSGATADMMLRRGTYSIEKARRLLGYEPLVDLDEGMRRTGEWLAAEGLL